jgi:hypothetical protein
VWGGVLPAVVDQAEAALIDRDREIYEFGDELVRPAMLPIRIAKDREPAGLRLVAADFQRFDKRSEELVSIDCPKPVAATYLEPVGRCPAPPRRPPLPLGVACAWRGCGRFPG